MSNIVLDTNIILLDANNLLTVGTAEDTIYLPEILVDEVDTKKSIQGELGFQARQFGRLIANAEKLGIDFVEDLTLVKYRIDSVNIIIVAVGNYQNYSDTDKSIINDRKIIEVASRLRTIYPEVETVFMSNDVMARIRAESLGIATTDFKTIDKHDFTFNKTLVVPSEVFGKLHYSKIIEVDSEYLEQYYNYTFVDAETEQTKLGTVTNGVIYIIGKETEKELRAQDAPPLNAEHLFLASALQDPTIDLVIVNAGAGAGKSLNAISNGIQMVKQRKYEGILYIRNSVNDLDSEEEVGYLSTNEAKFAVYLHPLEDSLDFIARRRHSNSQLKSKDLELKIEEEKEKLRERYNIQSMITLGMRGRTFTNTYIILDEFQNVTQSAAQTILTRMGKGCKVVCIGSLNQIDHKWVNKYTSGLTVLLDAATKKHDLVNIAAVNLNKIVRSPLAEFAEKLFTKQDHN